MLSLDDAKGMTGSTLTGSDGSKIGKVSDVYIDSDTQRPEWALVHTGLFGGRESFVPLAQAQMLGGGVQVPYSKDQVKNAPNAEPDGELSQDEEAQLYAHYGLNYSEDASDSGSARHRWPRPSGCPGRGPGGFGPEPGQRRRRVGHPV